MNRSRIIVLMALSFLVVSLFASSALAGAKAPEKNWDWEPVDLAQLEP
jgi:hypothetical protein